MGAVPSAGIVLLVLFGNAFFVAAEYALVTARRSHLGELAARGDRRADVAFDLTRRPLRFVSTVQVGVTLFSILLGAVGTPLLEHLFSSALATTLAFLLAFVVLTSLHVVVGELVPKAFAKGTRLPGTASASASSRSMAPGSSYSKPFSRRRSEQGLRPLEEPTRPRGRARPAGCRHALAAL